jgi:hypothetical protein
MIREDYKESRRQFDATITVDGRPLNVCGRRLTAGRRHPTIADCCRHRQIRHRSSGGGGSSSSSSREFPDAVAAAATELGAGANPRRARGENRSGSALTLQPSLQQSGHRRGPGRRPCGIAASKTRIPAGAAGAVPGSHPAVPAGDSLTRMLYECSKVYFPSKPGRLLSRAAAAAGREGPQASGRLWEGGV